MLRLISPADMQACEKRYFETSSVPSIEIMENAAKALADTALNRFPDTKNIYIACGPGGNGGDGYACARLMKQMGKECSIYASAAAKSPDATENARRAAECGIEIFTEQLPESAPDLWIDCIYGTGLSREPSGRAADLIRLMNRHRGSGAKTIAADIPSGLNGRTGKAYDPCTEADITVTFQLAKYGHCLQDGLDVCGEDLIICNVGFPDDIFPRDDVSLIHAGSISVLFEPRRRNIHKTSCGHLLIVAGSFGMAGAAALCAQAALRSGVGLVTIACPESIVPILQIHAPCAMCISLPEEKGAISADALPLLQEALKGKSAVAMGCGLTQKVPDSIIRTVLKSKLPAVIDADAINIIAKSTALRDLLSDQHILTPHPGEAARLLGKKCTDPIEDARLLSSLGCSVVLKGASRVIAVEKNILISASGTNGMARGGSGDVLTGLMGGLLASDPHPDPVVVQACEIHGLAGEMAAEKYGCYAMNSADIIEFLPEVFKKYVE